MGHIFVSYKREDRALVARLVRVLEMHGFSVWWDPAVIPGEQFAAVIRHALDEASCVIVGWSNHSIDSIWVLDEASIARERGILVPVSLDGTVPPLGFKQFQTEDLQGWDGAADDQRIERLVEGVRRFALNTPLTMRREDLLANRPRFLKSSKKRIRQALLAGIAIVIISAIAAYNYWLTKGRAPAIAEVAPPGVAVATPPRLKPRQVGEEFRDCAGCPEMVVVPAGTFLMGSPAGEADRDEDEGPQTNVVISTPLAIGKFEITVGQFAAFVKATNYRVGESCDIWSDGGFKPQSGSFRAPGFPQSDSHPATCISWEDAKAFVKWLSDKTGKKYRLPQESEWEYVARAGSQHAYSFGNDSALICQYGNVADETALAKYPQWSGAKCSDGHVFSAAVGTFKPNNFGLYDLHGNVWEWVTVGFRPTFRKSEAERGKAALSTSGTEERD